MNGRVIPIRANNGFPMCPTCQHQDGGLICDACDSGDEYEIHEEIEEEFFS